MTIEGTSHKARRNCYVMQTCC